MHIIHTINCLKLEHGGTVRAVLDLVEHLWQRGHRVTIITSDRVDAPPEWDGLDGRPEILLFSRTRHPLQPIDRNTIDRAGAIVARADVVHLHGIWQPECRQVVQLAKKHNKPYVFTTHGMLDDWCMAQKRLKKQLYYTLFLKKILHEAAAVHCTAKAELEQAQKWFPAELGRVIPLVFDLEPFRTLPGPDIAREAFPQMFIGEPAILFLSRIHEKKGIERLIQAVKILRKSGKRFQTGIAGTGDDAYIKTLKLHADEAGVGDVVHFLGFVSGVTKVSLYEAADIFVLPTSQENFGLVLTEAMACGTPVITTKGVDIWPELEESGGAVITALESEALAKAIEGLLVESDRRRQMSERARRWVFEWLDPDRIIGQFEELYRSLSS